jgi:hypothetical protein
MGLFKKLFRKEIIKEETPDVSFVDKDYKAQTVSVPFKNSGEQSGLRFKFIRFLVPDIKMVHIDKKNNGNIYEVYFAPDYITGVDFLRKIPRNEIPPQYYIIVETPEGNIGKDIDGIFNESTGNAIE